MLRLRKILTVTLTILLVNLAAVAEAHAGAAQNSTANAAEKVKAEVGRLGAGTRVEVRLTDGTKLKGQLAEADDEGFMLVDSKGGRTRVTYAQVAGVKRFKKSNWKTFDAKGVATFAALMGGIFLVAIWGVSQTK
ncbi:MAG TPA: hypothetical protein VGP08_15670 [Pyrinomonadaceae bacterium]|nr:hypothetical protein [Pyrinomonadaceae bacterium]